MEEFPKNFSTDIIAIIKEFRNIGTCMQDVERISHAATSLLRIINSILDFSKIEAKKQELEITQLILQDVINDVTILAEVRIAQRPIELIVDMDPEIPEILMGDPLRLSGPILQPLSAIEPVETLGTSFSSNAKIPVVLWGGVDTDTVEDFKKMSPAGVASLGGIWNYADPVNAFIKLSRVVMSY